MRIGPTRSACPNKQIGGAANILYPDSACLSEQSHTNCWSSRINETCHASRTTSAPSRLRPCEELSYQRRNMVPFPRMGGSAPLSGRTQSRGESDASTRSARTSSRSGTSIPLSHDAWTNARVSYSSISSASTVAHPQTGVAPVAFVTPGSVAPAQEITDMDGASNPTINFHALADHAHRQIAAPHSQQENIVLVADDHHHHEYFAMADMVETKKSQIVEILREITNLTREQRARQEELHSERQVLAQMEAKIRAQGAEEARTRFQTEVAESRRQMGEELRMLNGELQQERRDSEAKKFGIDAMKNLYEKKCDSKDQEIRALREVLADSETQKAKIRELTDELRREREGRAVSKTDTTMPLLPITFAPAPGTISVNCARRRLSYSADCNEPIFQCDDAQDNKQCTFDAGSLSLSLNIFQAQEEPVELALPLESDGFRARGTDTIFPSVQPSTGIQTSVAGALSNDARRRLSYSRAAATVGTQTPETPAVDPTLGIALKLFDSQLEASSVNNTSLATPVTAEVSFPTLELSFAMASVDAPFCEVTTAHVAPPDGLTPSALEIAVSPSWSSTEVALQPLQADTSVEETQQIESHDLSLGCTAHQAAETTIVSVPPKAMGPRILPIAKATAKPLPRFRASANESVASQRSSSDRGRAPLVVDRSPRCPMRFSMSATPPKVHKESPPRGCVAEKVNLFEQRCTTPLDQTGSLNTPRQVGTRAAPEELRPGPRGAPVPTPTGAGAVAIASRLCRAEEKVHPRGSERASE